MTDTVEGADMDERICSVDGCDKPHLARGWCRLHYQRWKRHGNPTYTKFGRVVDEQHKECLNCGQVLHIDEFAPSAAGVLGRTGQCRACRYELRKDSRPNWEREWREANRDRLAAYSREWRRRNPGKQRAYTAALAERDPDRFRSTRRKVEHQRRARLRHNGVHEVSEKDYRRIYSSECWGCGSRDRITWDHVIPIERGGTHGIGNALPLCGSCNSSKGTSLLAEWRYRSARA